MLRPSATGAGMAAGGAGTGRAGIAFGAAVLWGVAGIGGRVLCADGGTWGLGERETWGKECGKPGAIHGEDIAAQDRGAVSPVTGRAALRQRIAIDAPEIAVCAHDCSARTARTAPSPFPAETGATAARRASRPHTAHSPSGEWRTGKWTADEWTPAAKPRPCAGARCRRDASAPASAADPRSRASRTGKGFPTSPRSSSGKIVAPSGSQCTQSAPARASATAESGTAPEACRCFRVSNSPWASS